MSADIIKLSSWLAEHQPQPADNPASRPGTTALARTRARARHILESIYTSSNIMQEIGEHLDPTIALAYVKIAAIARAALSGEPPHPDC
jgi:hypothetical protein